MALSAYEKVSVIKYIKEHALGQIYYLDLCTVLKKGRKASYTELVEFFTEYVLDNLRNNKTNPNALEKVISCIDTLISWCLEDNIGINSVLYGKLKTISSTYQEQYTLDPENNLISIIQQLNNTLEQFDAKPEDIIASYISQISALQKEIEELSKELTNQQDSFNSLEKKFKEKEKLLAKKNDESTTLRNDNTSLKRTKKQLEEIITTLKETIITLETKIASLESLNNQLTLDNSHLTTIQESLNQEIEQLRNKISELNQLLTEKEKHLKYYSDEERKKSLAENIALQNELRTLKIREEVQNKIALDGVIPEEMITYLQNIYEDITLKEIEEALTYLSQKINIQKRGFSTSPKYVIVPPKILTDSFFDITIPNDCSSYDILLISDVHISKIDSQFIKEYNNILDYCAKNNIRLILNAGDYFNFRYSYKTEILKGLTSSQKLLESAIEKTPNSAGVYHALLGGNHDKESLRYGIDAMEYLSQARGDFINLGYDHVTITFNGIASLTTSFMLHHPATKFPDPVTSEQYNNLSLAQSLKDYYLNNNRHREQSYFDAIGHFHRSGLDTMNGICTIPSLRYDRYHNGAWHLKIYFDEKTNIKYIIFKPLEFQETLVPTTEIAYQRLTLK